MTQQNEIVLYFTKHCLDNIRSRFAGLITEQEVLDKVSPNMGWRRHYVVKRLSRVVTITGDSACPNGDIFLAIVDDNRIVNVVLRRSTQQSDFYRDAPLSNGARCHNYTGVKKSKHNKKNW